MMMMHPMGGFWFFIPILLIGFTGYIIYRMLKRKEGNKNKNKKSDSQPDYKVDRQKYESLVFRLAQKKEGFLTVSDVVIATGLSAPEAESLLEHMVDGLRVHMNVSDSGKVFYEFAELTQESKSVQLELNRNG